MCADYAFEPDDVTSVLLWAAGSNSAPSDGARPEEDELLRLVDLHALTARLLRRLDDETPTWETARLRLRLSEMDQANRCQAAAHTAAAAEITRAAGGMNPVIVKGVSTYLVTGLPHTLRCGDIDMVCADGAAATEAVLELGYQRSRAPFMHEVGEFTRGTTEIDLHAYFPVHSYTGLSRDGLDAAANPGVWVQPGFRMSMHPIGWSLLDVYRVDCVLSADNRVAVPCPELLAIILSAHGFMNYTNVWSISHREKPYVRLGELADLSDLVSDARFDHALFDSLVRELDASDAVAWASWAFEALIGPSPLPQSPHTTFPRCLWWGWWAEVPVAAGSWLHPDWYDMERVTSDLGANLVPLSGGESALLRLDDQGALPRQLRLAPNSPLGPVAIRFGDGGTTVTLVLPERPANDVERVRVDYGSVASEYQLTRDTGHWSATGSHVDAGLTTAGDHRELTLRFGTIGRSRHLLVGFLDEDTGGRRMSGALVPIALQHVASDAGSSAP